MPKCFKMGLLPLEFTDCLTDSPYFRDNLHAHEKELEKTSLSIKGLIKEVKDLLQAAKNLSRAQRNFSQNLINFRFQCIGNSQTDDEIIIAGSLKEFGKLISTIEDERERMLERAYDQFIVPLENFRKEHIGGAKEGKKKFDKQTAKFCNFLERHLNMSTKKSDSSVQEADAIIEMEQRAFVQSSLEYVFSLQEVQERKKFEFVETILGFMYGWLTFYHQGHEIAKDYKPQMTNLQLRIQRTRDNFNATRDETELLMRKMLEVRKTKPVDPGSISKMYTRQGYLFLMEKKAFGTTTWTKHYCQYRKESKVLTMIPYSQQIGKITSTDTLVVKSCTRRPTESIEKRFCFDIVAEDRPTVFTLQALSEEDHRLWLDALDGKEPTYSIPSEQLGKLAKLEETFLDETGFMFVKKCIAALESRGLEDQGLYRLVGVSSKVNRLLLMALDQKKVEKLNLMDLMEWETNTITSALKNYFRNLPEPLMTFRLHDKFIAAAKQENRTLRLNDIHTLVRKLPDGNLKMLTILIRHLSKVAEKSDKNLMTVSNLGVCFGPTLLMPEEETVAAIMDIKFGNVVVEILIENYDKIFRSKPDDISSMEGPRLVNNDHYASVSSLRSTKQLSVSPSLIGSISQPLTHAVVTSFATEMPMSIGSHPNHHSSHNSLSSTVTSSSSNTHHQYHMLFRSPPVKGKPLHIYNPLIGQEGPPNHHSSSESLSSRSSRERENNSHSSNSPSPQPSGRLNAHNIPASYKPIEQFLANVKKPSSVDSLSLHSSPLNQSISSNAGNHLSTNTVRVRTLYHCEGENANELSFEPHQIITNVKGSREPGWLEGTLNGKTGLIPENYVEYLP